MCISKKIMEKVERKEEYNKNFNKCLGVSICPQCGAALKRKNVGGENLIEIEYTCPKCQFTHTRLE